MSGCSWDSQVEKPVEWLLVEVLERRKMLAEQEGAEGVWTQSWMGLRSEQFKTQKSYCNKNQNLNLKLRANRSGGTDDEDVCSSHTHLWRDCLWLSLIQLLCVAGKQTWLPESPPRPAWLHSAFPCSFREASSTVPQLCILSFSHEQAQ